jgi:predicted ATPase/DNA-binding winged helix-turn-helix (wHTH) protein
MSRPNLASDEHPAASRLSGGAGGIGRLTKAARPGMSGLARIHRVEREQLYTGDKVDARRTATAEREISFDRFRLLPAQRLLLEGGKPVRLGSRALELLIALTEHPGELVSKRNLMAWVWPDTFVDDANLKVQIAVLRRTLGEGRDGNRYISTVAGRGYCFVMPLMEAGATPALHAAATKRLPNLPASVTPLIGRGDTVSKLAAQLSHNRLITLAGPGGIGKTSVALAVAERLTAHYEHGVWFVDLTSIRDPLLVPHAVASAIGFPPALETGFPSLLSFLRGKRMLVLLDSCEHVIEGAAGFALGALREAPRVHVLATSREPLRVDCERVHRLFPLASPAASPVLSAADALGFPSIQLFVERAAGALGEFQLQEADVGPVVNICRKLDGLPLAIEFAAAAVDTLGIDGVASRLGNPLRLPALGRRTAASRHRTLRAALDWSYHLLTHAEQTVLRRLAVFSERFTLETAATVLADAMHPESEIVHLVAALVAKSLIAVDNIAGERRFQLLETTRAYACEKLVESGEMDAMLRRHAECCRRLLAA